MYRSEGAWRSVDEYFVEMLAPEDAALLEARRSGEAAGLPAHEVAANQGKLLSILCQMIGANRVLEIGTLAGYSTIWLGRSVGADGHVTTLELDPTAASLARENVARAGLVDRVLVREGPAVDSLRHLVARDVESYDLVFIDADKGNNPVYLDLALQLVRVGGVIVADNVVRNGDVADRASRDERVVGTRRLIEAMASSERLEATALQTVGLKGWDGFAIALVIC